MRAKSRAARGSPHDPLRGRGTRRGRRRWSRCSCWPSRACRCSGIRAWHGATGSRGSPRRRHRGTTSALRRRRPTPRRRLQALRRPRHPCHPWDPHRRTVQLRWRHRLRRERPMGLRFRRIPAWWLPAICTRRCPQQHRLPRMRMAARRARARPIRPLRRHSASRRSPPGPRRHHHRPSQRAPADRRRRPMGQRRLIARAASPHTRRWRPRDRLRRRAPAVAPRRAHRLASPRPIGRSRASRQRCRTGAARSPHRPRASRRPQQSGKADRDPPENSSRRGPRAPMSRRRPVRVPLLRTGEQPASLANRRHPSPPPGRRRHPTCQRPERRRNRGRTPRWQAGWRAKRPVSTGVGRRTAGRSRLRNPSDRRKPFRRRLPVRPADRPPAPSTRGPPHRHRRAARRRRRPYRSSRPTRPALGRR